jgi:hypothetical protein
MQPPLEIAMQGTPNPNAAKVTLNRVVAPQGQTFRDPAAAALPWAKQLLEIAGVTQVFAINNFITVTKAPDAEWAAIAPAVEQVITQAFA